MTATNDNHEGMRLMLRRFTATTIGIAIGLASFVPSSGADELDDVKEALERVHEIGRFRNTDDMVIFGMWLDICDRMDDGQSFSKAYKAHVPYRRRNSATTKRAYRNMASLGVDAICPESWR